MDTDKKTQQVVALNGLYLFVSHVEMQAFLFELERFG